MFSKISSLEKLYDAYREARKGKRFRKEILEFSWHLERNLLQLQWELETKNYVHGNYRDFIINESKKREIKAAPFKDRIVHHTVYDALEPRFDKSFIYDSYACRNGKGTHKAVKRLEKFMQSARSKTGDNVYCLKCDVSKYFASIDHEILKQLLFKKVKNKQTRWLLCKIINSSYDHKIKGRYTGIPIGNLTSQLFANVYLNQLDQFIKQELKQQYYLRYMDDFLLLGFDKEKLHNSKRAMKEFLNEKLNLKMHPRKQILFPISKGINFLGYVTHGSYRFLRKDTVKRFKARTKNYERKLKRNRMSKAKFKQALESWQAYAEFGDSWGLRYQLSKQLNLNLLTN